MKFDLKSNAVPLSEVLEPTSRPIRLLPTEQYKCLGVQWYAKGVFIKEAKNGSEIAAKTLFAVEPGEFIYNRLFAWKGSFALTSLEHAGCVVSGEFPTFRIREKRLLPRFLQMFCSNEWLWDQVGHWSTGTSETSRSRLKEADLLRLKILLPPLSEQHRIVALLDQAENLRTLRQQADRRTADLIPALFHNMFGQHVNATPITMSIDGLRSPVGWRWSMLTDVARLSTGHTPSRRVPEYWNGNIPWITLTDIRELDGKVANQTSEQTTELGISNSSAVKLPAGTVCFSRTASVGFVTIMGHEMCTSQDFVNWTCGPDLDPDYLMASLIFARNYLRSQSSGSTHRTIYFPVVQRFGILIPPLSLQKKFTAAVADIRAMQQQQAASKKRLDDLFQSLLHRAFRGEL